MKPGVLHVDLAGAQRRVLHLRRKRLRHRVAKNTQANRRINIARDFRPFLEIGECVAISSFFFFFHTTAWISLTPCFSRVPEANHGISIASAVCSKRPEKPLKRFDRERRFFITR